jgi:curved DNA-binding protein CbpA
VPSCSVATAASILGVSPQASEAEVQAAYRRLIVRTHPDQGGTEGLAAELNAAREAMLKR